MKLQRWVRGLMAATVLFGMLGMGTSTAGAATRPPGDVIAGHFQCSPPGANLWVKQYWPNMTSITGQVETVWFRPHLQKWMWNSTTAKWEWRIVQSSQWYNGASNVNGRIPLFPGPVYFMDGVSIPYPYEYKLFNASGSGSGYYRTIEEYFWGNNARHWWQYSTVGFYGDTAPSSTTYCKVG